MDVKSKIRQRYELKIRNQNFIHRNIMYNSTIIYLRQIQNVVKICKRIRKQTKIYSVLMFVNGTNERRTLNNLFLRYSRDDVTSADAESPNNKSVAIIDVLLYEKWK